MIYWLFEEHFSQHDRTLRMGMAAVLSFLIVLVLGPAMIRYLLRRNVSDSNTPTMGGVLIVLAIFVSVALFANLQNMYIRMALLAVVWLGVLGGMDDWLKLRQAAGQGRRDGLKVWEKLLFQIGLSVLVSVFMYKYGGGLPVPNGAGGSSLPAHNFYIPFIAAPFILLPLGHAVITTLTMVGSSNAVNLTDGMDGLAAGCVIIVAGLLTLLSWGTGLFQWSIMFSVQFVPDSLEMTILCSAIVGASLGFLWYNANPAQVYMGDTGSLLLGGLLGYVAVVIRQEMLLFIAGGVFVMEALSVILQVGYYKATKDKNGVGRRIFRMAPLHHHFHMGGLAKTKVVIRFWILSIIFAVLAMASLKLKW